MRDEFKSTSKCVGLRVKGSQRETGSGIYSWVSQIEVGGGLDYSWNVCKRICEAFFSFSSLSPVNFVS